MNASATPQLVENARAAGLVLVRTPESIARSVDQTGLGMACIELIGRLENEFATACDQPTTEYIDEAAETARKMLILLETFCYEHLQEVTDTQAGREICKAYLGGYAFDEVLKTRPIGNALLRTFWKADEVNDIKEAHDKLGKNLVRAVAAALYQAIMMLGPDSRMGPEIDQSTVVFISELDQRW